jgi:hypothetical protein
VSEETLISAARRLVRFVRIDASQGGGLLGQDTIQAAEVLDIQLTQEQKRLAQQIEQAQVDAHSSN